MYSTASPTVWIFSASSSGNCRPNSSSNSMTSSTTSRESASRSSLNVAYRVTFSSSTPRRSTMISFTFAKISSAIFYHLPSSYYRGIAHPFKVSANFMTIFLHIHASIDMEDLTGNVTCSVRCKKRYKGTDILRFTEASQWNLFK